MSAYFFGGLALAASNALVADLSTPKKSLMQLFRSVIWHVQFLVQLSVYMAGYCFWNHTESGYSLW
ncbi:hypothetical protein OH492_14620 [Vibrio chagasii]|nr:hypothetical protein [Vibrio chagasii]